MLEIGSTLYRPSNIVPTDKKERDAWMQNWDDYIAWSAFSCWDYNNDVLLQQYAQGHIPESEFDHITNMFVKGNDNLQKVLPARISDINYIITLINKQRARALENDIVFSAAVADEDAIIDKLQQTSDKAAAQLTRLARQEAGLHKQLGKPIVEGDDIEKVDESKLRNMSFSSEQADSEIAVSKGMKWLMDDKDLFLKRKFIHQGFFDLLTTNKMAFNVLINQGNPDAIPIPPQQIIYDLNHYSPFIQHGDLAGYWFYATPQEIVALCPELTKAELQSIDSRCRAFGTGSMMPLVQPGYEWWYQQGQQASNGLRAAPSRCIVIKSYWKATEMRRAHVTPNIIDENSPHIHFIEDGVEPQYANPEKGEYIGMFPKEVIYESTRIADIMTYKPHKLPETVDNLPIIGIIDPTPSATKIVKDMQRLIVELWYTLERLSGQAKGKVLAVDRANTDETIDNIYNMLAFQVYEYDSTKEGEIQTYGNQPSKNLPTEIDMGLSSAVADIMRLLVFAKQTLIELIGGNDAANGMVKSDQTSGNTQNAVMQAQMSMQVFFDSFYETIEMVGQALADNLQSAWANQEKNLYLKGLKGFEFFHIKPEDIDPEIKHKIRIENSVRSDRNKTLLIQMAEKVLPISDDPMMALTILKLVNSSSSAEAEEIFTKGVDAMNKLKAQESEAANQKETGLAQAAQHLEDTKMQRTTAEIKGRLEETQLKETAATEREKMKLDHKANEQEIAHDLEVKGKIIESLLEVPNNNT